MLSMGITGSRNGTSKHGLARIILDNAFKNFYSNLHHGNCVGVDETIGSIAKDVGFYLISHPPIDTRLESKKLISDESCSRKDFLDRDRDIVDEIRFLLSFPSTDLKTVRSGTWYTTAYAIEHRKPTIVISPNSIQLFHNPPMYLLEGIFG